MRWCENLLLFSNCRVLNSVIKCPTPYGSLIPICFILTMFSFCSCLYYIISQKSRNLYCIPFVPATFWPILLPLSLAWTSINWVAPLLLSRRTQKGAIAKRTTLRGLFRECYVCYSSRRHKYIAITWARKKNSLAPVRDIQYFS